MLSLSVTDDVCGGAFEFIISVSTEAGNEACANAIRLLRANEQGLHAEVHLCSKKEYETTERTYYRNISTVERKG